MYGFIKTAAVTPKIFTADCRGNAERVGEAVLTASMQGVRFAVCSELCITGSACGDLFYQSSLLAAALDGLRSVAGVNEKNKTVAVVGLPIEKNGRLYNCAAVIYSGKILGVTAQAFPRDTHFAPCETEKGTINICGTEVPFGTKLIFRHEYEKNFCFAIEIGSDFWSVSPPSAQAAQNGAVIIACPCADFDSAGRYEKCYEYVEVHSERIKAGFVFVNSSRYESVSDRMRSGCVLIAECGSVLRNREQLLSTVITDIDTEYCVYKRLGDPSFVPRFNNLTVLFGEEDDGARTFELNRSYGEYPFVPWSDYKLSARCGEFLHLQARAIASRMRHLKTEKIVLGLSGGQDSALALFAASEAFKITERDPKNIIAVTMPCFGTSEATLAVAKELAAITGVTLKEIDITESVLRHFNDIGHPPNLHDLTFENAQARERTQVLMDIAGMHGTFMLGTGDMSELALGFTTYGGDHMSMFNVNASVPKTLIKHLLLYAAENHSRELTDAVGKILAVPASPELLPQGTGKETEKTIGPYVLHDFFLHHMIRRGASKEKILFLACETFAEKYSKDEIEKWLVIFMRRFFANQFKRSCMPDGPAVGEMSLSPRGGFYMPADASGIEWS
ncbi:MAG: NAD(+) synthase [Defluviitaleaceae bacterium]|nr:NAD(+) synthase [Defluviitaleaceae bacterium]